MVDAQARQQAVDFMADLLRQGDTEHQLTEEEIQRGAEHLVDQAAAERDG